MKTLAIKILIALLASVAIISGCGKDQVEKTNLGKTSQRTISFQDPINTFRPAINASEKHQMIERLDRAGKMLKSGKITKSQLYEDTPVAMARWLTETTLNTNYANLYDSTLSRFRHDSIFFTVSNKEMDAMNLPILDGNDLTLKYYELSAKVDEIKLNDSVVHLIMIYVISFDQDKTYLMAIYSTAKSELPPTYTFHLPIVLKPGEPYVPFDPSENYFAVAFTVIPGTANITYYPNWCGKHMEDKLNAHKEVLNMAIEGYIVEVVNPPHIRGYDGWDFGNNDFWHTGITGSLMLNANTMNQYLGNYYNYEQEWYLDDSQYGIYLAEVNIWSQDTYEGCNPYNNPFSNCLYNNDWVRFYHYMVGHRIKLTPIPPLPPPSGN